MHTSAHAFRASCAHFDSRPELQSRNENNSKCYCACAQFSSLSLSLSPFYLFSLVLSHSFFVDHVTDGSISHLFLLLLLVDDGFYH